MPTAHATSAIAASTVASSRSSAPSWPGPTVVRARAGVRCGSVHAGRWGVGRPTEARRIDALGYDRHDIQQVLGRRPASRCAEESVGSARGGAGPRDQRPPFLNERPFPLIQSWVRCRGTNGAVLSSATGPPSSPRHRWPGAPSIDNGSSPDQRVLDMPRPPLWRVLGQHQVFVMEHHSEPLRRGPGALFAALLPASSYVKGSGGGRVLPLFRRR